MTSQLLQFAGSLAAVLALAWIARTLGLGGDARIGDEAHARALAEEALCGFEPVEIAIDRAGLAGLARDAQGRVMLLRRHGAHFAGRLLTAGSRARIEGTALIVATTDRRFGEARLDLGDGSSAWAQRIERL